MLFTPGAILTVGLVLLCSLLTLIGLHWRLARRVARLSRLASLATRREQAPERWESALRELRDEQVSLSSSFEKLQRQVMRLNSRAGMRELRDREAPPSAPPVGASKAELRKHYGFTQDGPEFAKRQLSLVPQKE